MNEKKTKVFEIVGRTPITIIFGVCFFVSQAVIVSILVKLNVKDVLILQTTFQNVEFSSIIKNWKSNGISGYYFTHYYFDFIHPLFYSVFLCSLMVKAFNRHTVLQRFDYLLNLPFIAGLFDVMENTLHLYMILNEYYPSILVIGSSLISISKWIITFCCLVLSLILFSKKQNKANFTF